MDRPAPVPPQHRDIVYCHGCENEWYRDEGGLECPECHSDFTEIVEPDHDPRDDDMHIPADDHPLRDHNPWDAPDPDEDDIDQFHFQRNGPGQPLGGTYRATINRTIDLNAQGQPIGGQGQGGGIMGLIGNALGGVLGPALQQYQQQQQQQRGQGVPSPAEAQGAPGSPRGEPQQQQQGNNGSFTRQIQGPGYSFTITSSSTGGGNLFPRNANGPQPFQNQPDHMDDMLRQMMQNIGVFPRLPGQGAGGQRQGPGGFMFDDDNMHPGGPMPFPPALMGLLGMAGGGGVHGDAVYSQEALDRIVSQLMEQHQTGNAPGPASESAINSLPARQLTQEDFGDDGKADCSICMEDKQLGDSVTVLPCGHWFDKECVREWLTTHDTCPHCRQGIMPKEQQSANAGARQSSQAPLNDMANPPIPGEFPNANAGSSSGSGTRDSPFNVPDSPGVNRSGRPNPQGGNNNGIFGSMRNAFGGGGDNNGGRS